jgi:hypothetical protein
MARDAYKRTKFDQEAEPPQEFIDNFINACIKRIPTPEEVSSMFSYEEVFNYIPLPQQIRVHIQGVWENEMQRQIAETMWAQRRAMMNTFFTEIGVGLRDMVAKVCESVRDSIKQNDRKLVPKATSDLRRLIEKVEKLNFSDDGKITEMIQSIKAEIYKPIAERDSSRLATVVDSVLNTCKEQIQNIVSQRVDRFDIIELDEKTNEANN